MAGCYCFCCCYLDSSNKINRIASLFFEEIYNLSLPIIDEFLCTVVVSTASPVEEELKIRQKALKSRSGDEICGLGPPGNCQCQTLTDTALKVSQSVYCFTISISHGVENYFPRLWGTGISDAIFGEICSSTF